MNAIIFNKLQYNIPKIHGWCDVEKALTLASIVIALRPKVCIEIGVFGGRSLVAMALACKEVNGGVVHGIDPWKAQVSVAGQTEADAQWWSKIDHEKLYQDYLKLIADAGVSAFVQTHRMTSDEAFPKMKWDAVGLLHVDGSHTEQAFRDIMNYSPLVQKGGICVADDIEWAQGYVKLGFEYMKGIGFVELYKLGTGAAFMRL